MNNFLELKLNEKILKTLDAIGFTEPTPIQKQAIPLILEGDDIIASAETGTGKTAAFLLPALDLILNKPRSNTKGPSALILVPTRELAEQVAKEAARFSKQLPFVKTVCIYGGVPYPQQNRSLSRPYQILVATPGRLLDHLQRGRISLANLNYFVLDEADRMLDMGFVGDVEKIAEKMPKEKQTLLFSATFNKNVLKISNKIQDEPFEITIESKREKQAQIEQKLYYVDNINHKIRLLENLLEDAAINQAIVFTSTKMQADKLSTTLEDMGYLTAPLHGDIHQRKRNATLKKLRLGKIQILVATDIAARGIDVPTLTHVFNFDVPRHPEDFIHRIGRTGRAGASGTSVTFATYSEIKILKDIDRLTGKEMEICTVKGIEPQPPAKASSKFKGDPQKRFRRSAKNRGKPGSFSKQGPRSDFRGSRKRVSQNKGSAARQHCHS